MEYANIFIFFDEKKIKKKKKHSKNAIGTKFVARNVYVEPFKSKWYDSKNTMYQLRDC